MENSVEGVSKRYGTSKEENATSRSERLPLEMAFEKDVEWWHADSQRLHGKAPQVEEAAQQKAQNTSRDQEEASLVGVQAVY